MLVYLGGDLNPIGYTDSDFQSDKDSRKSTLPAKPFEEHMEGLGLRDMSHLL